MHTIQFRVLYSGKFTKKAAKRISSDTGVGVNVDNVADSTTDETLSLITISCVIEKKNSISFKEALANTTPLCFAQEALMRVCSSLPSNSIRMVIPQSQVARVIGKHGRNLKKIRKNTVAEFEFTRMDANNPRHSYLYYFDNLVEVRAPNGEAVSKALRVLSTLLYMYALNPEEEYILTVHPYRVAVDMEGLPWEEPFVDNLMIEEEVLDDGYEGDEGHLVAGGSKQIEGPNELGFQLRLSVKGQGTRKTFGPIRKICSSVDHFASEIYGKERRVRELNKELEKAGSGEKIREEQQTLTRKIDELTLTYDAVKEEAIMMMEELPSTSQYTLMSFEDLGCVAKMVRWLPEAAVRNKWNRRKVWYFVFGGSVTLSTREAMTRTTNLSSEIPMPDTTQQLRVIVNANGEHSTDLILKTQF
ncbi:uncharacterized protein LOC132313723 isoform X2 [Cornus florida]|nr:uncharacterized protein LOC132313723 isoform X2 [Cornus florida]XP_059668645.1 uncharacterized protein LOC132313723 isoform X2 [Cornus florida]